MVDGTSTGSVIGASSTRKTPCSKSPTRSAATWRLRRVLPVPPGPVSVTRRTSSWSSSADLGHLALATEQGGRVGREVVRTSVEGEQRGKVRRQAGGDDLEDMLRPGQVLESMLPEIEQARTIRHGFANEGRRRIGEQDLAAMADTPEPSAAIDRRAVVVAIPELGLAGVEADPHARSGRGVGQGSAAKARWMATAAVTASSAEANTAKRLSPSPRGRMWTPPCCWTTCSNRAS